MQTHTASSLKSYMITPVTLSASDISLPYPDQRQRLAEVVERLHHRLCCGIVHVVTAMGVLRSCATHSGSCIASVYIFTHTRMHVNVRVLVSDAIRDVAARS